MQQFTLDEIKYHLRQAPLETLAKLLYWGAKGNLREKLRYHHARRLILESGIFDAEYYQRTYPSVTMEPLHHYLVSGAVDLFNPSPLFDAAYYVSHQTDINLSGQNPLLHYIQFGAMEGRNPHPLFSSSFYLACSPDVVESGVNPLRHYLLYGAAEGRDPHPLFDTSFYLVRNPFVPGTGLNPLVHYLEWGFREGRVPHWMFDPAFYYQRNPDVAKSGMNPLLHYIGFGARELRDPHPLFDCSFYLSTQPDVRRSGVNPLEHFVRYGVDEGRSPHFMFDLKVYLSLHPGFKTFRAAAEQEGQNVIFQFGRSSEQSTPTMSDFIQNHSMKTFDSPGLKMSVVIPTHNRVEMLEGTLQRCLQVSRHLPVEFIVVSDGCTDNTLNCLQWYSTNFNNVRFAAIEKSGAATARNVGAAKAQGDLIMFIGDDIRPVDSEFFAAHIRGHEKLSEPGTVIEGHVDWPKQSGFQISAVMRLIQGTGAQQFGYHYMQPHGFFDWSHFWSANISIKRGLVKDWAREGFSPAFRGAAYEDIEFAYRIFKSHPGLRIYYAAESVGEHFHYHGIPSFIKRQISAGEMARVFVDLHPELANLIQVEDLDAALRSARPDPMDVQLLPEFEGVVQGLKSWSAILDAHQHLGSQEWHDVYLNALFQLCHGEGYLNTFRATGGNLAEGYRVLLRRFQQQMATSRSAVPIVHSVVLS